MSNWVSVCATGDVELEEVIRFDYGSGTYAIYRSPEDRFYATAGLCTHEAVHLTDGLVMDHTIECPKHGGAFDYTTGQAKSAPACINLRVYPVKVEDGMVLVDFG